MVDILDQMKQSDALPPPIESELAANRKREKEAAAKEAEAKGKQKVKGPRGSKLGSRRDRAIPIQHVPSLNPRRPDGKCSRWRALDCNART